MSKPIWFTKLGWLVVGVVPRREILPLKKLSDGVRGDGIPEQDAVERH
jgi:hypothetical protein